MSMGWIVAWIMLLTSAAKSATLAGIELPDQIKAGEQTLSLNGIGIRQATLFRIDVYVAGLYLESKSSDPLAVLSSPGLKRIEMRFMRSVSQKQISETWNKGMKSNCTQNCTEVLSQLEEITSRIPAFSKGDALSITFYQDRTEIFARGQSLGSIQGAAFSRALLSVWLGVSPPSEELKKALLSQK